MTGYMYNETIAKAHFWVIFVSVNITFFPQHFLGLAGMPRRYIDYPDAFALWNRISSYGAYLSGVGAVLFLYVLYDAFAKKRLAGNNPWGPRQPRSNGRCPLRRPSIPSRPCRSLVAWSIESSLRPWCRLGHDMKNAARSRRPETVQMVSSAKAMADLPRVSPSLAWPRLCCAPETACHVPRAFTALTGLLIAPVPINPSSVLPHFCDCDRAGASGAPQYVVRLLILMR